MKLRIRALIIVILFIAPLFSCKKDTITNELPIPAKENITQKAKEWFNEQAPVQIKRAGTSSDEVLFNPRAGEPLWDQTTYSEIDRVSITPVVVTSKIATAPNKYLITEFDKGKVVNGYIGFILPDKKKSAFVPDAAAVLNITKVSKQFSGAIIKYDLKGTLISSKHFENGIDVKGKSDKMVDKINAEKREGNSVNYAPVECYIIDHWWVTWDTETHEIICIEYEGSTQVCTGGGGGNNGPTNTQVAEAAAESILNTLSSASDPVSIVDQTQSEGIRTKLYTWKCVKSPTWHILAHDIGVHKKILGSWRWQSLENQGISTVGYVVGGSISATKIYANPTIGTYNAVMDIMVNVASTVTVSGTSATKYRNFGSAITHNVNSPSNPGY